MIAIVISLNVLFQNLNINDSGSENLYPFFFFLTNTKLKVFLFFLFNNECNRVLWFMASRNTVFATSRKSHILKAV